MQESSFPNHSSPFFTVQIASSLGSGAYTFVEAWSLTAYPTELAEKAASGRSGTSFNPGYAVTGATFAVGDYALCRSADGCAGATWELYPVGSGGGAEVLATDTVFYSVTADDTWEDTGLSFTTTEAGTYLLVAQLCVSALSTGSNATVRARLLIGTDEVSVAWTKSVNATASTLDTLPLNYAAVIASGVEVKVQMRRDGATWSQAACFHTLGTSASYLQVVKVA